MVPDPPATKTVVVIDFSCQKQPRPDHWIVSPGAGGPAEAGELSDHSAKKAGVSEPPVVNLPDISRRLPSSVA